MALPGSDTAKRKWIKTGIEFYNGSPQVSSVVCDNWADWSLSPLPGGGKSLTIEMEREVSSEGVRGSTLCIYVMEGVQRRAVREVTWVFHEEEEITDEECWVGAYAAKPTQDEDDGRKELEVHFSGLSVETF